MPCCAITPDSGACLPVTARGKINRSSRHSGWRTRQPANPLTPILRRVMPCRCWVTATCYGCFQGRRQFAMVGALGQRVCVDPAAKLVMVQTALDDAPEGWRLWAMVAQQFE